MSLCDKLLNEQQEAITSFIKSLEKEISQNSQWAQGLIDQCSSKLPRSIQEQELIEKEKQNVSKLQVLEELQREAMEILKKQHHMLEEARLNLRTPLTYKAETSEAENYRVQGPRPSQGQKQQFLSLVLCLRSLCHQSIIGIPD